ncbi:helix-turn-helix transcriptional regulator [Gemella sanguinis]|uniref:helix-turn-helix domain-containing protein n=1 Tax=Gemella sanguinis TaxID=84135 RepID=UPI0028D84C4C|nr:helix-turn-helix transcriptional regulator [Gemella sanguinis]
MKNEVDKLMREKNMSNKELAVLTGLHVKTIREIRTGVVTPRYSSLRRIIKCLKMQNG